MNKGEKIKQETPKEEEEKKRIKVQFLICG